MARVPIVKVGDILLATVQEGLLDRDALDLQAELGRLLERTGASGVLLDISVVVTMDSFLGRLLNDIARQAKLLGANAIVVGMQPAVAITMVEMGLGVRDLKTALNVEKGLAMLKRIAALERSNGTGRGR